MKRLVIICLILVTLLPILALDKVIYRTKDFSNHGTRRLVNTNDRKVFYYRSVRGDDLVMLKPVAGEYTLKSISKAQDLSLDFDLIIDGNITSVHITQMGFNNEYVFFNEYKLNIPKGVEEVRIRTLNRNAYFRFFKKAVLHLSEEPIAITPEKYLRKQIVRSSKSESEYFVADEGNEIEFTVDGRFEVYFYARATIVENIKPTFDIYLNDELIKAVNIDLKKSGKYTCDGYECLSIGKKIELETNEGNNTFKIVPQNANPIFVRIMKIRKRVN